MYSSVRKILQALYYIQENVPKENRSRHDIMYLLKLIYFADRFHIRRFGFVVSGDKYYAMKNGPVASLTFDILKTNSMQINSAEAGLLSNIRILSEHEVEISAQADDELSESFREALDFSISTFGCFSQWELSNISHDYPEWGKLKEKLNENPSIPMGMKDFFENPKNFVNLNQYNINKDPYNEDEEFLAAMKADFCENSI